MKFFFHQPEKKEWGKRRKGGRYNGFWEKEKRKKGSPMPARFAVPWKGREKKKKGGG